MKARREALAALPQVRWRQPGRGRWRYGHLRGGTTEPDGSVRVWDNYNGGARSLPATSVQREARGPRGGRCWQPIQPPTPTPATADGHQNTRPPWQLTAGKADLFNQQALWERWPC